MSAVFEFLLEIVRFFTGLFSDKRENRKNLWPEILAKRAQLAEALAGGRISDVVILRKELDILMRQYMNGVKILERDMRRSGKSHVGIDVSVIIASALIFSGCGHFKKGQQTTFVLGDRVNIVQPGSTIEVPKLTPPAKQWYLMDNVAIQHWLGIPVDFSEKAVK